MNDCKDPIVGRLAAALLTLAVLGVPGPACAQGASDAGASEAGGVGSGGVVPEPQFMQRQLEFARVRAARDDIRSGVAAEFKARKLDYPPAGIFLRVFKRERIVELWVRPSDSQRYTLFRSYPMCVLSGGLGPKREAGDYQVPEGFYHLTYFNPSSDYLLSLGISYPNRADSLRAAGTPPGGDIFIHGGCKTIGCVPMTDEQIREIYWMAVEARTAGQRVIPVDIFPTRLDPSGLAWLERQYANRPDLTRFWQNLQKGYLLFEESHRLSPVAADARGLYVFGHEAELELAAERVRATHRPGAPGLAGRPADAPQSVEAADSPPLPSSSSADPPSSRVRAQSIVSSPPADVRSIAPAPGAPGPPLAGRPLDASAPAPAAGPPAPDDGAPVDAAVPAAAAEAPPRAPLAGRPAPFQNRPLEHGLIQIPRPAAAAGAGGAPLTADSAAPPRSRTRRASERPPPPLLGRPAPPPPDSAGAGGHGGR